MARSDGELEGIYRFLNNHRVGADGILDPHYRATLARMAPLKRVAVVHDSTQFAFRNGVAEVLGYLPGPGQRGIVGLCLPKSPSGGNALSHNAFSVYGRTCVESSVGPPRDDEVAVPDAAGARA